MANLRTTYILLLAAGGGGLFGLMRVTELNMNLITVKLSKWVAFGYDTLSDSGTVCKPLNKDSVNFGG
jgi:hypothetical protein